MQRFSAFQKAKQLLFSQIRGQAITSDLLQAEFPQHYLTLIETAKETILLIWILWIVLPSPFYLIHVNLFLFGWLVWKVSKESYLGYEKLQTLHRIIEEERYHIEHHRQEERKELEAIYSAKGLSSPLLDEVLDVFMASDNRLLQIMLEEEMGIVLESYEHPLKLGCFAALGVGISSILLLFFYMWFERLGLFISGAIFLGFLTIFSAKKAKNKIMPALIWQGAIATLVLVLSHFFMKIVL